MVWLPNLNSFRLVVITILMNQSVFGTIWADSESLDIPGTTQTISGYDTELGEDAICWSSIASATQEEGIPFPSGYLVENFTLSGKVDLHTSCFEGTWLEAHAPPEFSQANFRPRTLQWYNYTIKGQFNLSSVGGEFIASEKGSQVAVHILACDSVQAGFCSPFVHEQANIRLAREQAALGPNAPPPPKRVVGNRHGGTHVHSPPVFIDVPPIANVVHSFEVEVPMLVNDPGHFYVVGTLQFFSGKATEYPTFRYDVANALPGSERLVSYQEPVTILQVRDATRTLSYICIFSAGAILLFLLEETIRCRKSQVMQISQAPFLIAFLVAALVATISCILLEPENDLWCNLSRPMILIPLQLFYSITLGRLWRINAVVSPLLRGRLQRATSKSDTGIGLLKNLRKCLTWTFNGRDSGFRREVSSSGVIKIITAWTIPQVLLQVLSWVLQPQSKVLDFNQEQSIARCICDDGQDMKHSLSSYSMILLLVLVFTLLIMAHASRRLPSLLNESSIIYDTTVLSVLLMILGLGVIGVTNEPTTSPDVQYIIQIALVLSVTVNSSMKIVFPKIRMVWAGQEVLVSQLVQDNKQSLRKYTQMRASTMHNVSGLGTSVPFDTSVSMDLQNSARYSVEEKPTSSIGTNSQKDEAAAAKQIDDTEDDDSSDMQEEKETEQMEHSSGSGSFTSQNVWNSNTSRDADKGNDEKTAQERLQKRVCFQRKSDMKLSSPKSERSIVIREGAAPSKQLMLRMIDLQTELDYINQRIMSGMMVKAEEWESVRKQTAKLELIFKKTHFEWEQKNAQENC